MSVNTGSPKITFKSIEMEKFLVFTYLDTFLEKLLHKNAIIKITILWILLGMDIKWYGYILPICLTKKCHVNH